MAFTTRRGRPRAQALPKDPGTPELRFKHALGLTREPLDVCLEKNLLTADQHRAGLHFRWLYTLRYGLPTVRALDLSTPPGGMPSGADELWRQGREVEFREASRLLHESGTLRTVLAICVMQYTPAFFTPRPDLAINRDGERQLAQLRDGLGLLARQWFSAHVPKQC